MVMVGQQVVDKWTFLSLVFESIVERSVGDIYYYTEQIILY